jgi:hypothetical protein
MQTSLTADRNALSVANATARAKLRLQYQQTRGWRRRASARAAGGGELAPARLAAAS